MCRVLGSINFHSQIRHVPCPLNNFISGEKVLCDTKQHFRRKIYQCMTNSPPEFICTDVMPLWLFGMYSATFFRKPEAQMETKH